MAKTPNKKGKFSHGGAKKIDKSSTWKHGKSSGSKKD